MPKYSVLVSGHSTSISLEQEFWNHINRIAREKNMSVNQLVSEIDKTRKTNLSSALRLHVLKNLEHDAGLSLMDDKNK